MDDLISRQAAIDRIESHIRIGDELYPLTDADKILNHAFEIAASCVYNLPSAQPERMRGRWMAGRSKHIETGEVRTVRGCSECGATYFIYDEINCSKDAPNFCPNCGADMRGTDDVD